jgi:sulfur relay (sulfurtransferase) complex TusBCD TusD component (DsrE family)
MKKILFLILGCMFAHGSVDAMERHYPLHDAIGQGNLEQVTALLNSDVDANEAEPNCTTPLHEAIYRWHKDIALLLLRHGANVNAQDINGRTPLHQAAFYGNRAAVQLLLEHGADVYVVDGGGETPYLRANYNSMETSLAIRKLIDDHIARSFHCTQDSAAPSAADTLRPEQQQKATVFVTKSGYTVKRRPITATSASSSTTIQAQSVAAVSTVMVNACYSESHLRGTLLEVAENDALDQVKTFLSVAGANVNLQDSQGLITLQKKGIQRLFGFY